MTTRTWTILVGLTGLVAPLALGACGAPPADVSAVSDVSEVSEVSGVQARPVADQTWSCPKDVAFLQSLQTAYEHLEGHPAGSISDLEAIGFTEPTPALAATITDGVVVGTSGDPCLLVVYTDLDLDPRCAAELDRFMIDMFTGAIVGEHLGSSLGPIEQARAVGVDHGPYAAYAWNDEEGRWENVDPACPDEDALGEALARSTNVTAEDPCITERKTLETAAEAYLAMTGGQPPVDEQTLVAEGFLRTQTEGFDLAPDGSVVPAPGSACA